MSVPATILHIVASSHGGGAAHVRDLALGLDAARYRVQVAMPEDGGNVRRRDFEGAGIAFHAIDIAAGLSRRALTHVRRLAARADLVHVHGARAALFGRLAASSLGRRRPRVVFTVHGFAAPHYPRPRRDAQLAVERLLAPWTDAVICVSQAERASLQAAGIGRHERTRVVYNGIPMEAEKPPHDDRVRAALGISHTAPLITTVSRLYIPRDFTTLLHAFCRVQADVPNAHLLIVGDGPHRPSVEAQVAELGLDSRVSMAGIRRDVLSILAASDIYVLATAGWEGLPLTILEAMACALPVVASDVGGVPEALEHGASGLIVPPRQPDELAAALLRLLNDRAEAHAMGARGRERVLARFTIERMVAETEAIYRNVLEGRRQ